MSTKRPISALAATLAIVVTANLTSAQMAIADDLLALEEQTMQAAVAHAADFVVRIETFGGREKVGRLLVGQGPTTGLVVSSDGYIVSSAFNFVQQPTSILVTLPDGRRAPAEIVSRDHSCKLVLLKVPDAVDLTVPTAVPLDELLVGQWAVAVGRTFDFDTPNRSIGILSAVNRIWGKALQTDANVSPNNYGGPLIDVHGRVMGVLVPLSPDGTSEVAGAEWYDSGIGFAVPLAEIYDRLERMREGDLHRGVLGVTMESKDIYSTAARVITSRVHSPAYEAGIRAGDVVIRCAGVPIERQAQLKHVLGPRYAGEIVTLTVRRGDEQLDFEVELIERLEPYAHPYLGILPMRGAEAEQNGVKIRYVFPSSGAEAASLQPGDRISQFGETPIKNIVDLRSAIANQEVGATSDLTFERDGQDDSVEVRLSELPADVPPNDVPAPQTEQSVKSALAAPDENWDTGEIGVKIPEEPNECFAYVPDEYDGSREFGLLVHCAAPGNVDTETLMSSWRDLCDEFDLILVAPMSQDPDQWQPTEVDFFRKVVAHVTSSYQIDPSRITLIGQGAGGSMAYVVGFRLRDLVRGIIAIDAAIPGFLRPPETDPVNQLSFFVARTNGKRLTARIDAAVDVLERLKHPVTLLELNETLQWQQQDQLRPFARWIDSLDRI